MKTLGAVQAALWASSVCFSSCGLRALSRPVVGALSAGRFRMAAIGRRDLVLSVAGAFSHGEPGDAVGWGIVGLGDVCAVKAGPAFVKAEGSALVAVMRRTPGAAEVWAKRNVPGATVEATLTSTPFSRTPLSMQFTSAPRPVRISRSPGRWPLRGNRVTLRSRWGALQRRQNRLSASSSSTICRFSVPTQVEPLSGLQPCAAFWRPAPLGQRSRTSHTFVADQALCEDCSQQAGGAMRKKMSRFCLGGWWRHRVAADW